MKKNQLRGLSKRCNPADQAANEEACSLWCWLCPSAGCNIWPSEQTHPCCLLVTVCLSSCTGPIPSACSTPRGEAQRPGPPCPSALQTGASRPRVPYVQNRWLKLWGQGKYNVGQFLHPAKWGEFYITQFVRQDESLHHALVHQHLQCRAIWDQLDALGLELVLPQEQNHYHTPPLEQQETTCTWHSSRYKWQQTRSVWCFCAQKQAAGGMEWFPSFFRNNTLVWTRVFDTWCPETAGWDLTLFTVPATPTCPRGLISRTSWDLCSPFSKDSTLCL